jgi:hypothetical protein
MSDTEPDIGDIWRILDDGRASLALIVGPDATDLAKGLAGTRAHDLSRVGLILSADDESWREPERALRLCQVLIDLDILFSPEILIDPMRLLTRLARRHSVVAVWPGEISGGVASYSEPGRRDRFESEVPDDALVVRTKATTFPYEANFEVESVR